MKLLQVSKAGIEYEFRLLEQSRVVEITKGDCFTYLMKWSVSLFHCDCPGSRYHHKCWHSNMITLLKRQPSVQEPWAKWAEDAGVMMYRSSRT